MLEVMDKQQLKRAVPVGILVISLPLFLFNTNPNSLPLPLLVVPIVLIFLIIYFVILFIVGKLKREYSKSARRTIAVLLTLFPTLLIVLQSLRQLTLLDLVIILSIFLPLSWYLLKIDYFSNKNS
jgi:hypothetical protein